MPDARFQGLRPWLSCVAPSGLILTAMGLRIYADAPAFRHHTSHYELLRGGEPAVVRPPATAFAARLDADERRESGRDSFGALIALRYNSGYTPDMKTAISVPDPLFRKAERLAKKLGMSRSQLYSNALAALVTSMTAEDITTALNEVYSHEPSKADPVLSAMQMATLRPEDR